HHCDFLLLLRGYVGDAFLQSKVDAAFHGRLRGIYGQSSEGLGGQPAGDPGSASGDGEIQGTVQKPAVQRCYYVYRTVSRRVDHQSDLSGNPAEKESRSNDRRRNCGFLMNAVHSYRKATIGSTLEA